MKHLLSKKKKHDYFSKLFDKANIICIVVDIVAIQITFT